MNGDILQIVLPVFLVITLGFSLKKTGLVKPAFIYDLNRLIYFIALPSLLFHKISVADFFTYFNLKLLVILALTTIGCCIFSYYYCVVRGYPQAVKGAFCQGSFRGNLAYIGLAIAYQAFGEEGLTVAGILLGFLVPLFNFLSIVVLVMAQKSSFENLNYSFYLKQVLYNPLILASISGIVWSSLGWPLPVVVDRSLSIVTGMALPLALIAIGSTFSLKKLKGDLGIAVLATCNKTVFMPLLTGIFLWIFGIQGLEFAVGVLLAGTPVAAAAYIMAQQLQADAELSGAIIALSTIFSLFTYTIILYVLQIFGFL